MIDLHCHILPDVDDGSPDLETSLQMGRIAAANGITTIVATPHCNLPNLPPNYRSEALMQQFQALAEQFQINQIPVSILPGAEVFGRENLEPLLDSQRLLTLNHSRYLLIEFDFGLSGRRMSSMLGQVVEAGLVPVVAHPERYDAVQEDLNLAGYWFHEGAVIQMNKGSITGRLGRRAYYTSHQLLERGLVHVIATDAHHCQFRTPHLGELWQELDLLCPKEYVRLLLEENPARILRDEPIPSPAEDL